ncbi:MAG: ThuA domain-containing protein [Brevinematia bacterium]
MNKKILLLGGGSKLYHPLYEVADVFKKIAERENLKIFITDDRDYLQIEKIRDFDLLICSTTEGKLTEKQARGLREAVIGSPWGKIGRPINFIGIHGASTSFVNQEWYYRMLGGRFLAHPEISNVKVFPVRNHPFTDLMSEFELYDELYLMEYYPPFQTLLYTYYNGIEVPLAWVKNYGLGRVFYLASGHNRETLENPHIERLLSLVIKDFINLTKE